MIQPARRLLAAFYRLLPIHASDEDLRGLAADEREALPANFSAVAVNGFFFPTAGRIVAAVSMASAGFDLASKNYVLALSPNEQERPFYIGVNDTAVGLPTSLLAATGLIIDLFGFVPVFVGTAVFTLAAVGLGTHLPPEETLQD